MKSEVAQMTGSLLMIRLIYTYPTTVTPEKATLAATLAAMAKAIASQQVKIRTTSAGNIP